MIDALVVGLTSFVDMLRNGYTISYFLSLLVGYPNIAALDLNRRTGEFKSGVQFGVRMSKTANFAMMASAPESDGRFFKVPKVIER